MEAAAATDAAAEGLGFKGLGFKGLGFRVCRVEVPADVAAASAVKPLRCSQNPKPSNPKP